MVLGCGRAVVRHELAELRVLLVTDRAVGQICVLFIMALAAAEISIALSIVIAVYRNYRSIGSKDVSEMNG